MRFIQRLLGLILLISVSIVILSGIDLYMFGIEEVLPSTQHLRVDIFLVLPLIIHTALGGLSALKRKGILSPSIRKSILTTAIVLCLLVIFVNLPPLGFGSSRVQIPEGKTAVYIENNPFIYDPTEVETVRPDLFNPGHFSMFDVLVHLDKKGMIQLEYHFDTSMNTHIIESINDEPDWWYWTYYSGGWQERNVFRMDHYPWKEGTMLKFYREDPTRLQKIYSIFEEEVTRRKNNGGKLVIPQVIIRASTIREMFVNVEVTPHNLRSDLIQPNITTALNVILSMGDQDLITYELKWYESIGTAEIVKSYWVEAINGSKAYSTCGFVDEAGSNSFGGITGNHIHLPADVRILNSPEYVEFFWICI